MSWSRFWKHVYLMGSAKTRYRLRKFNRQDEGTAELTLIPGLVLTLETRDAKTADEERD